MTATTLARTASGAQKVGTRAGTLRAQSRPRRAPGRLLTLLAACVALAAPALALPDAALAHGPVAPVATPYLARIQSVPPGLRAKVVDGYVRMWLSVPRDDTVIVSDYLGAPYLRFDRAGVQENENSSMYYLNQTPVAATPPSDLSRSTPPHWLSVSSGHSDEWHDGRLQALASQALEPGERNVGPWRIPLLVNGRATAISGELYHGGAPSPVWFWPIVVLLACVLAAWRLHDTALDRRIARVLGGLALTGILIAGIARGLHGRPSIPPLQIVELVAVLAYCGWALREMLVNRVGYFVFFTIAFVALWEGLNVIPALLRHYVLLALPPLPVRIAAVLCLGGGLGILVLVFRLAEARPRRAERVRDGTPPDRVPEPHGAS